MALPALHTAITLPADGVAPRGTLVFIHGFPDTVDVWKDQIECMSEKGFRCLALALPGFAGREQAAQFSHSRWGYGFTTLADAMAKAIRDGLNDESKVTLVIHDWGSLLGFWLQNRYPHLIKAVVAMDVGPMEWHFGRRPQLHDAPKMLFLGLLYHFMLCSIWLFSLLVPFFGARLMDRLVVKLFHLGKLPIARYAGEGEMSALCIYPYAYLWRDFVLELVGLKSPAGNKTELNDVPSCPCLFFWGQAKGITFHNAGWADALAARTDGSEAVPLKEGEHYLMLECPDEVNSRMDSWLAARG